MFREAFALRGDTLKRRDSPTLENNVFMLHTKRVTAGGLVLATVAILAVYLMQLIYSAASLNSWAGVDLTSPLMSTAIIGVLLLGVMCSITLLACVSTSNSTKKEYHMFTMFTRTLRSRLRPALTALAMLLLAVLIVLVGSKVLFVAVPAAIIIGGVSLALRDTTPAKLKGRYGDGVVRSRHI